MVVREMVHYGLSTKKLFMKFCKSEEKEFRADVQLGLGGTKTGSSKYATTPHQATSTNTILVKVFPNGNIL